MRIRPHEIILAVYFAITAAMIAWRGLPDRAWVPLLLGHLAAVALILLVLPHLPERRRAGIVRSWLPVLALPLIYKEVAVLNTLFVDGYRDAVIQSIEAALFGSQPAATLRLSLPWKPLSEYLHFGYFGYYALFPIVGGALYLRGRLVDFRLALTVTLGTFLSCYLLFIIYPVAGPWYHFERPDASIGWIFPAIIHAVLEKGAAQGAAFPSSHAAAAVAIWLLAWRLHRPIFLVLAAIVPALVIGTVYGGFHYAIDSVSGVLVGIAGYAVFSRLHFRMAGTEEELLEAAEEYQLPTTDDRPRVAR